MSYEKYKLAILKALNDGKARGKRTTSRTNTGPLDAKDQAEAWAILCHVMDRLREDKADSIATKRINRLRKEIDWLCDILPEAKRTKGEFEAALLSELRFFRDRFSTADFVRSLGPIYSEWTGAEVAASKSMGEKAAGPFVRFVSAVMEACGEHARPEGIQKSIGKQRFKPRTELTGKERFAPALRRLIEEGELSVPPSGSKPKLPPRQQ